MNSKIILFIVTLFTIISCGSTSQNSSYYDYGSAIKGNRKVVTKKIKISDYDEISIAGSMQVEYEQKSGSPFFEVTVDENILPHLNIEVKGKKLTVGTKRDKSRRNNIQIRPTVFKIRTNSKHLVGISSTGSGRFIAKKGVKFDRLNISKTGSGSIEFTGSSRGEKLTVDLTGSGKINIANMNVDYLDCSLAGSGHINIEAESQEASYRVAGSGSLVAKSDSKEVQFSIAGSGKMQVKGDSDEAKYSISGSGTIAAFDHKTDRADANISGSGKIELSASDELYAHTSSNSGKIYYKGKAKLKNKRTKEKSIIHVN